MGDDDGDNGDEHGRGHGHRGRVQLIWPAKQNPVVPFRWLGTTAAVTIFIQSGPHEGRLLHVLAGGLAVRYIQYCRAFFFSFHRC